MLLNDLAIKTLSTPGDSKFVGIELPDGGCILREKPPLMIEPFSEGVTDVESSYGLTSAGYDLRLDKEVWVYKNTRGVKVNPASFKFENYRRALFDIYTADDQGVITVPGYNYILVQCMEYLRIPKWLKGRCVGKSTYARCGVIVNTTPAEPGWDGHLTIEIFIANPCPVELYVGQGICQMEFELLCAEPILNYSNKRRGAPGKYQDQTSVTPPR